MDMTTFQRMTDEANKRISELPNCKPYYAIGGACILRISGSFNQIVHHFGDDTQRAHMLAEGLNNVTLFECLANIGRAA